MQRFLLELLISGAAGLAAAGAQAMPATVAAPFPPGSTPHFRHLGNEDGLSNGNIHALLQDSVGYMWIATDNGLQRYDGYRFVTYLHDPRDPGTLNQNIVSALAFAPDGTLWAGTEAGGLDSLSAADERFTHHVHDGERAESLADDRVFTILFDEKGRMWVGTDKGLDRSDDGGKSFRHYATHSSMPNGERILTLHQDRTGRLWVGSDHGVFFYDPRKDGLERLEYRENAVSAAARPVLDVAPIGVLYNDRAGRLWIGSEHGIGVLGAGGALDAFYTARPADACGLPSDHARGIIQDEEGDIWIALLHGGLVQFDPEDGCFTRYHHDPTDPASLRDDDLRNLYQDRTGLYWMGSYYNGLDIYNPRTRVFGYYPSRPGGAGLAGDLVTSAYKQADGTLWVGTLKGLTRLDKERRRFTQYIMPGRPASAQDDHAVNAVLADHQGRLWVGSDYGVSRWLPKSDSFEFHPLIGPGEDPYRTSVSYIFEDRQQRLWLGTEAGLVQFDPDTGKVLHRYLPDAERGDALQNGQVNGLCQGREGTLWVATLQGLARFDGVHDSFQTYNESSDPRHGLSSNTVLTCLGAADGRVWVGTNNGLDLLDPRGVQVTHYGRDAGLPDLNISGLLQDPSGDLWIATDKGITRFSPQGKALRNYAEPDGLQKGGFNAGAAYAAPDGELFFGGSDGLNSFYPGALSRENPAPDVTITRFTVMGKPLTPAPGTVPVLRYRDNILGFEFAAFDYAEPSHNRFRYTLEGFDEEWHTIAGERAVTYTNLDPGRYVLHLRGSNDGLAWSAQEASFALEVMPPPWRSKWSYAGYLLALLLIGGASFYLYGRSLKRRQAYAEERNRRRWAEALHQLIQSVTALEDEHAIAGVLLDSLMKFIEYDRALFYVERDAGLALIATRGGDAVEQLYHERWPAAHVAVAAALRKSEAPRLLTEAEAATLEPAGQAPRHYLAVPLVSGNSPYRLLLVGRASKTIQTQGLDIAAAMAKQVSVALDRALLIKDLERLATTDSLTRLHIRRSFLQRAEEEFDRSRRYARALTVLMLDVDHFKQVNDSYGHEVGDRVLRVLADTCRASLRQQDVIGRYGGEEFVAYLPETTADVALDACERLRRSVETLTVNSPQGPVKVTVSIGLATYSRATPNVGTLINAADKALYEAKQKGRNRVVIAS